LNALDFKLLKVIHVISMYLQMMMKFVYNCEQLQLMGRV